MTRERVIHVAHWGMDGHGDGSDLQPFKTFPGALRRLRASATMRAPYTIVLPPGTYQEDVSPLPQRVKLRGSK